MVATLGQYQLIGSDLMIEQWRKPRSKKRRILRKWSAVQANWRPKKSWFMTGHMIIAHPSLIQQILLHAKETQDTGRRQGPEGLAGHAQAVR